MDTLLDDRFAVSSSGIEARHNPTKTSEKYTKATAKAHRLTYGIAGAKTQTTDALLAAADVLVFMNKDVYEQALREFRFDPRKCVVWHVPDMNEVLKQKLLAEHHQDVLVQTAGATFATIRRDCDKLYQYLTHTAWVDVVDAENGSTGLRLPIAWATDRGLWHRGVHVIVRTTDGKYVVGKRDRAIVFAPNMLQVTLGGGVDSGEQPLHAAVRETHEELGVRLPEGNFRPLFLHRHASYHPHYNKRSKVHVYVYAVTLPLHSTQLRPRPGEVQELRLVSQTDVRRLIRTHRLRNFGRLEWPYKFYRKALAYDRSVS